MSKGGRESGENARGLSVFPSAPFHAIHACGARAKVSTVRFDRPIRGGCAKIPIVHSYMPIRGGCAAWMAEHLQYLVFGDVCNAPQMIATLGSNLS